MTIAVLGTGEVGQALAGGLVEHGHKVVFGTQHTDKHIAWKNPSLKETKILSYPDAAGRADIVILSVKGTAAEDVVLHIAKHISGKTVIDTTNPIADSPPTNSVLHYFTTLEESLLERLQKLAPEAHFVKAFNSVGSAFMVAPDFGEKPTMFFCGNDADAKANVREIIESFGWEAEDMGGAEAARAIEPLCILWCIPGFLHKEWQHAFKLLKK